MNCTVCGNEIGETDKFCKRCGSEVARVASSHRASLFKMSTTPYITGYRIKEVLGVVTGLTPRTRGVLGQFVGGIQSMFGGEVTAFTEELEKAKVEAMERVQRKAMNLGANAIVGLDLETSDIGHEAPIVVISATGTAVIIEPESSSDT